MSDKAAFWTGLAFGTGIVAFLLFDKANDLARRGGAISAGLQAVARKEVERVAKESADQYMADVYGLTPRRIEEIGRIAQSFEARR